MLLLDNYESVNIYYSNITLFFYNRCEMMLTEYMKSICEIGGRGPGTENERIAAKRIAGHLNEIGVSATLEEFEVPHGLYGIYALLMCFATLFSWLILIYWPVFFPLSLLVCLMLATYISGAYRPFRFFYPKARSVNVSGDLSAENPKATVHVCCHIDTAKCGSKRSPEMHGKTNVHHRRKLLKEPLILSSAVIAMLLIIAVNTIYVYAGIMLILPFSVTLNALVMLYVLFIVKSEMHDYAEGANDNASGISVALGILEELAQDPPINLTVRFLAAGSQGAIMEGMRTFLKNNISNTNKSQEIFLVFDCVGSGELRYAIGEGSLVFHNYNKWLSGIAKNLSHTCFEGDVLPCRLRFGTGSLLPTTRGFPAISLISLESNAHHLSSHCFSDKVESIEERSLCTSMRFGLEMIRSIDLKFN